MKMNYNKENLKTFLIIFIIALCSFLCHGKENLSKAKINQITNFAPITTTNSAIKLSAANAIDISAPKDGLNKRNVQINDLSNANKVSAKSYDPPPEFYRGPGSTTSSNTISSSNLYASQDNSPLGYNSKPIAFPDTIERGKYPDASANYATKDYNKWQLLRGTTKVYSDSPDRISVGHYGSADHSTTHGGSSASYLHGSGVSAGYGGGNYASYGGYETGRPPYHNDYDGGPRYPVVTHGGGGGGGGGGIGPGYYIGSHSDEAGGIPFDVYGSKGHYAGAGGEYSYSSYPDVHESAAHKGGHGPDWQHKALLAKSFLIPLASAAVLGIAAAFVSNPLLLQLGTVSGPAVIGKRRKRRDLSQSTVEDLTKQQSTGQSFAYRAHRQQYLTRV